ncbi:MAG: S1 RNA-binding domain-containing protein [Phycisphaeraceae bacterium]|nr:S1 RNA-binding domain-containing protein [Phycisphaeraceae bacterium]MBX3407901.1 S1 RNA-binding domain-containing protein [Phycisphaeraceae bacterium]
MDPHTPPQPIVPAAPDAPGSATSNGPTAQPEAVPATTRAEAPGLSSEVTSEIDEAMAALGFIDRPSGKGERVKKERPKPSPRPDRNIAPIGGYERPKVHGPRVVQAGREHRSGIVVSVGPTDIFLEFGPKELGVAPRAQWPEDALPKVGEEIEVVVDKFESSENIFVCSRPGAVVKAAWENLSIGQIVEARVVGVNKGGLELEVGGHRAFMPASQVSLDRIPDLSVFVGEKMTCQVSQLDTRGRGNIVLSRRDLLQKERVENASKLKDSLQEGQTLDGTVRKIMPFGAFVDIGGVDGLVHISDLTYDRTGFGENAVGKHVKEGQQVRVKVLKIEWDDADIRKSRISLGMKQLAADPFQTAVADIKEGAEVGGRVTRLAEFGAFVELAPGVEGLVHVSEIAYRRIGHPQDELKIDQVVQCKVLKIDPDSRRISLSVKAMLPAPEPMGGGGGGGGGGGRGGRGRRDQGGTPRTEEEIRAETPAMRRLRAQAALRAKSQNLKGGY